MRRAIDCAVRATRRCLHLRNLIIANMAVLCVNLYCIVTQLNKGYWPVETFFQPSLTARDKATMMDTLRIFTLALEAANVTYVIYGGTLMGSFRHHDIIPWDDDVDVFVNTSQKRAARDALRRLAPQYELYIYNENNIENDWTQWKFYSDELGSSTIHKPFKWPYVDIFFFAENATHIWDTNPHYKRCIFAKSTVLPVRRRPFGALSLFAPCDPAAFLAVTYDVRQCRSSPFSHSLEMPVFTFNTREVACSRLHAVFPFVHRSPVASNFDLDPTVRGHRRLVNETVRIGDWTLYSIILPDGCS